MIYLHKEKRPKPKTKTRLFGKGQRCFDLSTRTTQRNKCICFWLTNHLGTNVLQIYNLNPKKTIGRNQSLKGKMNKEDPSRNVNCNTCDRPQNFHLLILASSEAVFGSFEIKMVIHQKLYTEILQFFFFFFLG